MTYRVIQDALWTDPKVRAVSADAKLAFVYLITRPHGHVSGLDYLLDAVAVHETGLTAARWKAAFEDLEGVGLVEREGDLVWVKNMLRHQGAGPRVGAAVAKHLRSLHGVPIVLRYLAAVQGFAEELDTLHDTLSDRVSATVSYTVNVPVPVPDTASTYKDEVGNNGHSAAKEKAKALREAVERVWKEHLDARRTYFDSILGKGTAMPTLTARRRKLIGEAIHQHGEAKAANAGRGIFLSPWHTGEDPKTEGKRYLDPELAWRISGSVDNVERFSTLLVEARSAEGVGA